jgi:hypothetical protein
MPADHFVARPPAPRPLGVLLEELRRAREEVCRLRRPPIVRDRLAAAQQSLLVAMESYAAELTARGMPTPWKLRDDLRLQRSIGGRGGSPGPAR